MIFKTISLAVILYVTIFPSFGQHFVTEHVRSSQDSTYLENVDMDQFNFLSGNWHGEALGGIVEETWSKNNAGHLMGMFRFFENGKLVFSEFCSIQKIDNTVVYIVKHFDENMIGWETKDNYVKFPLIHLGKNIAYFDGATIELDKDGFLVFYVLTKNSENELEEMTFKYQLQIDNQ